MGHTGPASILDGSHGTGWVTPDQLLYKWVTPEFKLVTLDQLLYWMGHTVLDRSHRISFYIKWVTPEFKWVTLDQLLYWRVTRYWMGHTGSASILNGSHRNLNGPHWTSFYIGWVTRYWMDHTESTSILNGSHRNLNGSHRISFFIELVTPEFK
jgi:hypothetical protein